MLWTAIIVSCVASLRFLAYQQWFMTKAATKAALDVSGVHEGIDAFEGYDAADHKYWHHWCPRNVFIGDSYSGWMICEPDDVTELSGAVVYSLGIDAGVNKGKGDLSWEIEMSRTYRTVHHIWDSHLHSNIHTNTSIYTHPYDVDARYLSHDIHDHSHISPPTTTTNLTLDSMMRSQGHKQIAILKIDLSDTKRKTRKYPAAELDLIDVWDSVAYFIPADQVLIQFHHETGGEQFALAKAVGQMKEMGFRLFHRNERALSFIRV